MSIDYKSLLSRPADSVKKPPLKPSGTYFGIIKEHKFDVTREKKTPFVRFTFNNIMPGPDLSHDALRDAETGEMIDLTRWNPHKDFFLTDDALYRLKEFMVSVGVPHEGRMLDEMLPETRGMAVTLQVTQGTTTDGKLFNNIGDVTGQ